MGAVLNLDDINSHRCFDGGRGNAWADLFSATTPAPIVPGMLLLETRLRLNMGWQPSN